MLEHSFIHLNGVGETTEQKIWSKGIRHWNDYLENFAAEEKYGHHCRRIASSKEALKLKDA
jgi:hypothetical protein